MNKAETAKLLAMMQSFWPKSKDNSPDPVMTVTAWQYALQDIEWQDAQSALFALARTSTFAPSIAEIVSLIGNLQRPDQLTEDTAWALVRKACQNGNYGSEEEFAKLPKEVQAIVHSPATIKAWAMEPSESFETVIGSNFRRSFRARHEEFKQLEALPEAMKQKYRLSEILKPMELGESTT